MGGSAPDHSGGGGEAAAPRPPVTPGEDPAPGPAQHCKRPAWISAEWCNRVPEPDPAQRWKGDEGGAAANGGMGANRTAAHHQGGGGGGSGRQARDPSAVAFARMHKSIGSLLLRIQATEAKYGDAAAADGGASAAGGRAPGGGATLLTMRAGVLLQRGGRKQRARDAAARAAREAHPKWTAPVDLNPGISFRPGSPQRIMAVAPDVGCALVARTSGLHSLVASSMGDAQGDLALGGLSHRERLQAGIQQLNAEFYASLKPLPAAA